MGLLADGSYATLDVSEALVERRQVTWITEVRLNSAGFFQRLWGGHVGDDIHTYRYTLI